MSGKRGLVGVLVFVVALVVIGGIRIIGPPSEERTRRMDSRRLQDLQAISRAVVVYHQRHQGLPATLSELAREPGLSAIARDPVTDQAYGYRVRDAHAYEVCATFDRDVSDVRSGDFWSHGAGSQCFTLEVKQATP
ncbi:MAG TPA: hypothetical protein VMS40_16550 [Vicinamibacterales bacterium]|nr:hypothetical protein [Vicinamibacterales bacterium]